MAVTDKERKLAATLSDPVLWGQAYLYNRDGSGRDYWPHQVEDLRCPAKNIVHLDGRDVGKSIVLSTDALHYAPPEAARASSRLRTRDTSIPSSRRSSSSSTPTPI